MGYGQTEATDGFGASKRSKIDPPGSSDCRLVMLYKVVKELWAQFFFPAEFGTFWLVAQEPQVLWTNRVCSWI